jgi:hypothetical protein
VPRDPPSGRARRAGHRAGRPREVHPLATTAVPTSRWGRLRGKVARRGGPQALCQPPTQPRPDSPQPARSRGAGSAPRARWTRPRSTSTKRRRGAERLGASGTSWVGREARRRVALRRPRSAERLRLPGDLAHGATARRLGRNLQGEVVLSRHARPQCGRIRASTRPSEHDPPERPR